MCLMRIGVAIAVGFLVVIPASARADFVHTGQADPTTEGWNLINNDGTETANSGSDGKDYWQINATQASQGAYLVYRISDADAGFSSILNNAGGWRITATAKVLATTGRNDINEPFFGVRDGNAWQLSLVDTGAPETTGAYYQNAGGVGVLLQSLDISAYHTYAMTYSPSSQSVAVTIDGNLAGTLTRSGTASYAATQANFGDANGFAGGAASRWNQVSFAPVPEPNTVVLLGGGLLGLLAYAWQKRR